MKDISNSVDDKLKIYASSQKVNIPDSYNLMVENRVDRCLKENVPAKYKIHKTVARVYGIDIHNVDVDVEHDMSNGSDGTFSSEYVYITDKSSGIEYSAAVDMQSVTVYYVEKNLAEYSSSSELENKPLYEQKAVEAENIAEKFMNYNEGWSKKEIEYAINSEKMLRKGIIDFYFTTKDGNVCKVSYSQSEDTFYSICVIDEKVCEAMRASYEEASQEQENAVIKTIIK